MSIDTHLLVGGKGQMSTYEAQVWDALSAHWERRSNRRGLPNWASTALVGTREVAENTMNWVTDALPEVVTKQVRRAGAAVANRAMRPALEGAAALLDLVNDWAQELNDPKSVEKLARKRGLELISFTELQQQTSRIATSC